MIESEFWEELRPELTKAAAGIHMTRVENSASSGVSDVTMAFRGREAWVELKMIRNGRMRFRASQHQWIKKRTMAGARVRVLAREDDERGDVYLFDQGVLDASGDVRPRALHVSRRPHDYRSLVASLFR